MIKKKKIQTICKLMADGTQLYKFLVQRMFRFGDETETH